MTRQDTPHKIARTRLVSQASCHAQHRASIDAERNRKTRGGKSHTIASQFLAVAHPVGSECAGGFSSRCRPLQTKHISTVSRAAWLPFAVTECDHNRSCVCFLQIAEGTGISRSPWRRLQMWNLRPRLHVCQNRKRQTVQIIRLARDSSSHTCNANSIAQSIGLFVLKLGFLVTLNLEGIFNACNVLISAATCAWEVSHEAPSWRNAPLPGHQFACCHSPSTRG